MPIQVTASGRDWAWLPVESALTIAEIQLMTRRLFVNILNILLKQPLIEFSRHYFTSLLTLIVIFLSSEEIRPGSNLNLT